MKTSNISFLQNFKDVQAGMILLLIFYLMLTLKPVLSQSPGSDYRIEFEEVVPKQGPHPSAMTCIIQDRHGFMWFGTSYGLLKYDGYTMTDYLHDPENPNSLNDNFIRSLLEDSSGMLWIGTNEGLNRMDPESDTIIRYRNEFGIPDSLQDYTVLGLCKDGAGILWIAGAAGLIKHNPRTGNFTFYDNLPGAPDSDGYNSVFAILEDKLGVLWIATSEGLVSFDQARERFTYYAHDPENPKSLSYRHVWSLYEDKQGVLWVGTKSGLSRMVHDDAGKISFERYFEKAQEGSNGLDIVITSFFEYESEFLWVGTNYGSLYQRNHSKDGTPRFLRCQIETSSSHSRGWVNAIYEDNAGTLWLGSNGVFKSNRQSEVISHYRHDPNNPNSISSKRVTSILEAKDGILWIGTEFGLNRFDRKNNKWTHFLADSNIPNSLSDNNIVSMCTDQSDVLWIATTRDGGLNKFDPQKQEWTHFKNYRQPNSLSYAWLPSVYVDRENVLWAGAYHGVLNKYNRQTDTFVWYKNDPGDSNTLSASERILTIFEDSAGLLWIGTDGGGLNSFDRVQNLFTRYQPEPGNSKSISHNAVTAIHEDQRGVLWVGTRTGLNKFVRNKTDGLANDEPYFDHYLRDRSISGILEDDDGHLWISSRGGSHRGLTRFNTQSETFRDFSTQGNLLHKSPRTGEMFVANSTGFYSFYPSAMKSNPHSPAIAITDFQIFNRPVPVAGSWRAESDTSGIESFRLKKSISATKEIELSYKESVFSFEFAALHYANPDKNEYAYKMEGFDKNWSYIGNRRFTTFTDLPAGDYTFRVKGSNNDGVWNEEGTSIKVTITPPPWKTWWAYTLYVMTIAGIFLAVRRFELSRARLRKELELEQEQAEKMAEIDQMKSQFFANISHEFRTPLTLILGPLQKLLSDDFTDAVKQQFSIMQRNAKRLHQLINQLLDLSKLEAGGMALAVREENVVKLLKGIVLSFSSFAERKHIKLSFEAPDASIDVYIDRDKLEKIVSNLLSNAFKFTPERGQISVRIEASKAGEFLESLRQRGMEAGYLAIAVTDTGSGIPVEMLGKIFDRFYQLDSSQTREQEGTGIGLALTKELVELHHGEIEVTSKDGAGATFIVRLPMGRAHLQDNEIMKGELQDAVDLEGELVSDEEWQSELEETHSSTQNSKPGNAASSALILIVEDNADVRQYIRSHLEQEYDIAEAVNGEAGIEHAVATIPDLIISDVMMPKMDGIEFCRRTKTDERTSHIPVILLTARAGVGDKLEGVETGADE